MKSKAKPVVQALAAVMGPTESTRMSLTTHHPPGSGDNSEAQVQAELESHVAKLQARLEPLMRTIDGEVEIRIANSDQAAPEEI